MRRREGDTSTKFSDYSKGPRRILSDDFSSPDSLTAESSDGEHSPTTTVRPFHHRSGLESRRTDGSLIEGQLVERFAINDYDLLTDGEVPVSSPQQGKRRKNESLRLRRYRNKNKLKTKIADKRRHQRECKLAKLAEALFVDKSIFQRLFQESVGPNLAIYKNLATLEQPIRTKKEVVSIPWPSSDWSGGSDGKLFIAVLEETFVSPQIRHSS
jgi:hypothetical protein